MSSSRATVSAPYAVGGNLAEDAPHLSLDEKKRLAKQSARDAARGGVKSASDAMLDDSAIIKARFPDRQDVKSQFKTSASEMSKAIPKSVEITLYDTHQTEKMGRLSQLPARLDSEAEAAKDRRERLAAQGSRGGLKNPMLARLQGEDYGRPGSGGARSRSNSPAPGSRSNSPAPGRGGGRCSPSPRTSSPAPMRVDSPSLGSSARR